MHVDNLQNALEGCIYYKNQLNCITTLLKELERGIPLIRASNGVELYISKQDVKEMLETKYNNVNIEFTNFKAKYNLEE